MFCYVQVTVAERVREVLPDLPRAERRVAHEILDRYPVAGLETVARLAARAKVSGPTVVRFVGRLGFDSYSDFQDSLLSEIGERSSSPLLQYDSRPADVPDDVIDRLRQALVSCVDTSLTHLDRRAFEATVDKLTTGRRIFIAGGRFTSLSAQALAIHLDILRPGVTYLPPDRWVSYGLSARRGDVLVAFDVRRYQRLTVQFGLDAHRKGADLIVITDPWLSPLAREASTVLTVDVRSASPFDSLIAIDGLVEVLVAAIVERLGDQPRQRIAEYDRLWEQQYFAHPDSAPTHQEVEV